MKDTHIFVVYLYDAHLNSKLLQLTWGNESNMLIWKNFRNKKKPLTPKTASCFKTSIDDSFFFNISSKYLINMTELNV